MEFDYNYRVCPICEEEMNLFPANIFKCQNGCCIYNVDPQGETVLTKLFVEFFCLELYKNACLHRGPLNKEDYELQEEMDKSMQKFLKRIVYWKENDRYLIEIMAGDKK